MKLAIPSDDGLAINPSLEKAKGFLILSIELGEIVTEQMRWNKLSDIICSSDGLLHPIRDCQYVLVNRVGPACQSLIMAHGIEILRTSESIITNAYIHIQEKILSREANTCCCP